jgi:hypothetical protein
MTNEEAKFILGAFRPSGVDTGDPRFGDALRMAGMDPVMGQWFEKSRAYDSAVALKLRQVAPPASLRDDILAGARLSARPRAGSRRLAWFAGMAAAAALAAVVATMKAPSRPGGLVPAFASFAITDAVRDGHVGHGEPAAALVSGLQTGGAPMPAADQIDFERLRETGCRTLSFAGRDVLEVCFVRNGTLFHLYVARIDPSRADLSTRGPVFVEQAGAAAAVWSDHNLGFALATKAGVEAIRRLL